MKSLRIFAVLFALTFAAIAHVQAWVEKPGNFPLPKGTTITMVMNFDAVPNPAGTTWYALCDDAMEKWNAYMADLQLAGTPGAIAPPASFIQNIYFSPTYFGHEWGSSVASTDGILTSADVILDATYAWDATTFEEVVMHELGHVLGLDHPDQAGQSVVALMDSNDWVGPQLYPDDIAGIQTLHGRPSPITFTTPPAAQAVRIGATVNFTVAAIGTPHFGGAADPAPVSYQWTRNTVDIPGAISTTLTLTNVQNATGGAYAVRVWNGVESVTSAPALLTILPPDSAPVITTQPVAQTVDYGATATFSVVASGYPYPTYQWQKAGVDIPGGTAATLTLGNVALEAAGQYRVIVANSLGSVPSTAVSLTVNPVAPAITVQPVAKAVVAGTTATFSVTATGVPTPTYQWQRNEENITGATLATLTLPNVQVAAAGQYRVIVSNSGGNATSTAVPLTVAAAPALPSVVTQPLPQAVAVGSTATFSVVANGVPTPTYQWQKWSSNGDLSIVTGATSATLTIPNVQASDAANYRAVLTNGSGIVNSEWAALTITTAPSKPVITQQPASQIASVGGNVTLLVVATGGTPTLTYQWQKGGSNVPGATASTLPLTNLQASDAGNYTVIVGNSAGTTTSAVANLTLTIAPTAPVITKQPVAQVVNVGGTATFSVTATGTPTPTYRWQKGTVDIPGATLATLTLPNVQAGAAGQYRVIVANSAGSKTSDQAPLTVTSAPVITTQPADVSVLVGASVSFEVVASGIPAPTYQWSMNGQPVAGRTSATYPAFTAAASHNGYTFSCAVTNAAGTVTTRTATLTVTAPAAPVIVTQPADVIGEIGTQASFTVVATGVPAPTYQWLLNGQPAGGQTAASFIPFTIAGYHNNWTFSCVVTNASGSVTTRAARLTVGSPVPPVIVTQPQPLGLAAGQPGSLEVAATGASSFQWFRNGVGISGATGSTLAFPSLGSADAGIYDCAITGTGGNSLSAPVVVGIVPAAGQRTAGAVTTRTEWQDIHHPNGAVYDQFLLNGAAGTFTAGESKIARCSYLDENESIVQVEMSGTGAITIVLANATGPMAPALYNQVGIEYMKGKATVILSGADETTHFTIYSVGTFTNPGVTRPDVPYAGWADVAAAGVISSDGKLGGIHQGNVGYNATSGLTGLYAPTVTSIGGLVVVHDIEASDSAQPYLFFGTGGTVNVKIAGSNLAQPNADSITVRGLSKITMGAGQDSCGRDAPALAIQTALVNEAGDDVTAALVGP